MFSFLKKKSKNNQTTLICVVTSYTVQVTGIKQFKKSTLPTVLFSYEIPLALYHDEGVSLEDLAVRALTYALKKSKLFNSTYDRLVCYLGEPWVTSISKVHHLERKDSFIVTQKIINDMRDREIKLFEIETLRTFDKKNEMAVLEISQPRVILNGYESKNPIGQETSCIDIQITCSIAPLVCYENFVEVFIETFHRSDIHFAALSLAKEFLLEKYDNFTLIELGGVTLPITYVPKKDKIEHLELTKGLRDIEYQFIHKSASTPARLEKLKAFLIDPYILSQEKSWHLQKLNTAYSIIEPDLIHEMFLLKKKILQFSGPVILLGDQAWSELLKPLLERSFEVSLEIVDRQILLDRVMVTENAQTISNILLLAIIHTVFYEN